MFCQSSIQEYHRNFLFAKIWLMSPENSQLLDQNFIHPESAAAQPKGLPVAITETNRPPIKKTPLMLKFEETFARPGESIADVLKRLYVDEDKTFDKICRECETSGGFKISTTPIRKWIRQLCPEITIKNRSDRFRQWNQNPQNRMLKLSRIKEAWQDPEIKRQRIAKIHSKEARAKRSKSRKEYWKKHPQEKEAWKRKSLEARRQKAAAARLAALGENPQATLSRMFNVDGLTIMEIAKRLGKDYATISRWKKELGVEAESRRIRLPIEEYIARRAKIKKAIKAGSFYLLTGREQQALRALYLNNRNLPSLTSVAKGLKLTKEAIRQAEKRALAKIDKPAN